MLDITRTETKSLVLNKEVFNLNELILDAISDANKQISKENKDNDLKLELTSPLQAPNTYRHTYVHMPQPILIEADKRRISQVVSNLLTNAIYFTKEVKKNYRGELEDKNRKVVDLTYRIFISSTMDDLEEERQNIAIKVLRTENLPVTAEYMIDVLDPPRDALEKKLDGYDGYLGVFHTR
jgi:signal transduction histidine kinase